MNGYDQYRYEIQTEYSSLGDGETETGKVCPACNGGSSQEGSLSVTGRSDTLLYNCHRSSCAFAGVVGRTGNVRGSSRNKKSNRGVHIPTYPLTEATLKLLASKFYIEAEAIRLAETQWTGDGDGFYERRVAYPIYGPDSKKRGANYRSYQGYTPKSLINLFSDDAIACSWYRWRRTSDCVVLVEDQMSAIKVAGRYHSMALLGTNLSDAKIEEIKQLGYKRVFLSLDNDATAEAIKIQIANRSKLPNLLVMALQKDIKDMKPDEMEEYFNRLEAANARST